MLAGVPDGDNLDGSLFGSKQVLSRWGCDLRFAFGEGWLAAAVSGVPGGTVAVSGLALGAGGGGVAESYMAAH